MAEALVLVCDNDRRPATATVKIESNGTRVEKDLCGKCYDSLMQGTRNLRKGRRPKSLVMT